MACEWNGRTCCQTGGSSTLPTHRTNSLLLCKQKSRWAPFGFKVGENSDGAVRGCCIGACGWQERRVKKETSIASPSCSINSCDHTCLSQNHSPLIPNGPRVTWNPVGTSSYRSDSLNSQLRTKVAMPGLEAPVLKSCCQDLNSSYYY